MADRLRDWVGPLDLIVTSPYVRAHQSAEILAQAFPKTKIVDAPELVPHSPPSAFVKWIVAHGRNLNSIAVVGHEPHLSSLISYLITGHEQPVVEMKKSGVACLETTPFQDLAPGMARLNWLVQPRLLEE